MSRAIILVSIVTAIVTSLFLFPLSGLSWKPFRCSTLVSANVATKNGDRVELNVSVNIITLHKKHSEVLVIGYLKKKSENYTVYRRIFITHNPSSINGYSTTVITGEKLHPQDNVPNTLWQHYILPEVPGVAFYVKNENLKKNLLFYKTLENPILICTITED